MEQQAPSESPSDIPHVTVVSRKEWGAEPPLEKKRLPHPIESVVYAYNTGEPPCRTKEDCIQACRRLQKKHKDMGMADIYYNFLVGVDGLVYEGRGWNIRPPKSLQYPHRYGNTITIGIIGDGLDKQPYQTLEEVTVPGFNLVKMGVAQNLILENPYIFDDQEPMKSCEMPGC